MDLNKDYLKSLNIQTRPNASPGLWLTVLLPTAIITSSLKHSIITTPTYKAAAIFSSGLLLTSVLFLYHIYKTKLHFFNKLNFITAFAVATLFNLCLNKGCAFSLFSGVFCTVVYYKIFLSILCKLPQCFSIGEAALTSQAVTIIIYSTFVNLNNALENTYKSNMQVATIIIEIGLLGITLIGFLSWLFHLDTPIRFYPVAFTVFLLFIQFPLWILIEVDPVYWIIRRIINDLSLVKIILYWIICSSCAVLAIIHQINYGEKASTCTRKVFHLLALVVFLPGLIQQCSFLYLASGVVLGIFFALEILRLLRMPPLGQHLLDGFTVFCDEKDSGILALTPIYLLVGCSLPIWLHPSPCDVTDSASFTLLPLLSGLLSIGVGDTAASIVGSKMGRFKWNQSNKTIEGTVACILSQVLFIAAMYYFEFIYSLQPIDCAKILGGILITSLIEAKTDQIDNIVLPLVLYIVLI